MVRKILMLLLAVANFAFFYAAFAIVRRQPGHTIMDTLLVMAAASMLAALLNRWVWRRLDDRL